MSFHFSLFSYHDEKLGDHYVCISLERLPSIFLIFIFIPAMPDRKLHIQSKG